MDRKFTPIYLVELLGTFALVYFAAGAVLVNHLPLSPGQEPATVPLNGHQPGVVGIALAQGLILAVMLTLTVPVTGGYLNPALTIMLWVFNRLDTARMCWLVGAQLLGGILAALCLRSTFAVAVLQAAHFGAPHLNEQAYGAAARGSLLAGSGIELVLTFFLAFAIFALAPWPRAALPATAPARPVGGTHAAVGIAAGAVLAAGALMAYPLTGAAANPARWLGPVFWEWADAETGRPLSDAFVYIAGPIVGALAAGLFVFKVYPVAEADALEPPKAKK
jgi:aquaporin Z